MSKFITNSILSLILSSSFCFAEQINTPSSEANSEPKIKTVFHSAEAIHLFPKLNYLDKKDPGYNKVILTLEGFPKHKTIFLETKRMVGDHTDQYKRVLEFQIEDDGSYTVLSNPPENLKEIIGSSKGFLPGERVTYRFRAADNSIEKENTGIPYPAIVKNHQGKIDLRAELISLSPTVYLIDMPTMKQGEEYELKSTSLGEIVKTKATYSTVKPIHYSPAPTGTKSQGGEAILEIKTKSGKQSVIKLPWGTALKIHLEGKKQPLYH